jgi:hypothetical protein
MCHHPHIVMWEPSYYEPNPSCYIMWSYILGGMPKLIQLFWDFIICRSNLSYT